MIIIKNTEQIEGIKRSCQLAASTLQFIEPFVIEGVTTEFLNQKCEEFIREHNAIPAPLNYNGFPKAICTSINEIICHGIPNEVETLKAGDIINIDVTTILNGYYGDTSRMFWIDPIPTATTNLLESTKECLQRGIDQVFPGNNFGNIGYAIQKHAMSKKMSVVHQFVGHGVGLAFHEKPNVHHFGTKKGIGPIMKPGMIFTIEPMINLGRPEAVIDEYDKWTARTIDGKLSAQYEHTILVTEKGHEILTIC